MNRYSLLSSANEQNKLVEASIATDLALVALVDEEAGGIVAYISAVHADEIVDRLNSCSESQLIRFAQAVERKKDAAKRASEEPEQRFGNEPSLPEEQQSRIDTSRPQDANDVRKKNTRKGKVTADKYGN